MFWRIKIKFWQCWATIVSIPCCILVTIIELLNAGLAVLIGLLLGIQVILLDGFTREERDRNDLNAAMREPIFDSYKLKAELVTKIYKRIAGR